MWRTLPEPSLNYCEPAYALVLKPKAFLAEQYGGGMEYPIYLGRFLCDTQLSNILK